MPKAGEYRAPAERVEHEFIDADKAWDLVVENSSAIHHKFMKYARRGMGRPISCQGSYFSNDLDRPFRWLVRGMFLGRIASDFLDEIFPGILEACAVALDDYDESRGVPASLLDKVILNELRREFVYWQFTSSRQPVDRDDGGVTELFLVNIEEEHGNDRPTKTSRKRKAASDVQSASPDELIYEQTFEPEVNVAAERLAKKVAVALTDKEYEVLQMRADGATFQVIAEAMGYRGEGTSSKVFARAQEKARRALGIIP